MPNQYIVTRGLEDIHESYIASWAALAFDDAIRGAMQDGYAMPKLSVFCGKQLLWEYLPRCDGCCEVVKWSAPPCRSYRSTEWVLHNIAEGRDVE